MGQVNESPQSCTKNWFFSNTGVIVMVFLILVFLAAAIHIMHSQDVDTETLRWIRGKIDEVQTGLMAFLTGGAAGMALQAARTPSTDPTPPPAVPKTEQSEVKP